jgi:hypothetical protein
MAVQRDNEEERIARLDAILKHLRKLEKDTGKMISSVERELDRSKTGSPKFPKKR